MAMSSPAIKIAKAYAATKADEKALRAYGVKAGDIFCGYAGETIAEIKMRSGELLGVPRGLLTFGPNRSDWLKAEKAVSDRGAAIYDFASGLRSDKHGARMFNDAQYPPRAKEDYQSAQEKSVLSRVGDRTDKKKRAAIIWADPDLSIKKKEAMSGIPQSTLYYWFGKTTVPKDSNKK